MRRMTISMDDELTDLFDEFMASKCYTSRSETIRDLLRGEIKREVIDARSAHECVGALSYAESVIAGKGARHGKFNLIPVESDAYGHKHGPAGRTASG